MFCNLRFITITVHTKQTLTALFASCQILGQYNQYYSFGRSGLFNVQTIEWDQSFLV